MATNNLLVRIATKGERKLDALGRKMDKLSAKAALYGMQTTHALDRTNVKWKKHFDALDKMVVGTGKAIGKFVGMSAKLATLQVAALGAAMMAVHGSFVLGNASMKAFRWVAKGAAGAALSAGVAISTMAAAMREQQQSMFAFQGGKNYQQVGVTMRALMNDTNLAAAGAEALQGAFAAISKTSTFTAASQNLLKGLGDFAAAGQPLEQGMKAAGDLVAAIQDPKASFSKVTEAAKSLGPQMTKALEEAKKKGVDTVEELKAAITSGELATMGGVSGQLAAVNDTLISRFKTSFNSIKTIFADMGGPFLKPAKEMLDKIMVIFKRSIIQISGDIAAFGGNQGMFDKIVSMVDKAAKFFVDFIHKWGPQSEGIFSRMASWWGAFRDGWDEVLNKLRPLIDGARILEESMMNIFRPIGDAFSEGFGSMNDLIIKNKDDFTAFGVSIGNFIATFSKFAGALREIFVDALPYINKIVDATTTLVEMFTGLLGKTRELFGGGAFGSFALLAGLMGAKRSMKNHIGGIMPETKLMNVNAGTVNITGFTDRGQTTSGGQTAAQQQRAANRATRQAAIGQNAVGGVGGVPGAGGVTSAGGLLGPNGMPISSAGMASARARQLNATGQSMVGMSREEKLGMLSQKAQQRRMARAGGAANISYDEYRALPYLERAVPGGGVQQIKNNRWNRFLTATPQNVGAPGGIGTDTFGASFRSGTNRFRQARESMAYKRMFGGTVGKPGEAGYRQFKGINKSMGATVGAAGALGLASQFMPEEASSALALGSAVAMVNPVAGLAVGLIGGAVMGFYAAAKKRKKEAKESAQGVAQTIMEDTIGGMTDTIRKFKSRGNFSEEKRRQAMDATAREMQKNLVEASGGRRVREAAIAKNQQLREQKGFSVRDGKAGGDAQRALLKEMYDAQSGFAKGMTEDQFNKANKDINTFFKELEKRTATDAEAFKFIQETSIKKVDTFSKVFGVTTDRINELADAVGVNLYDATANTLEEIKKLAEGMIDTRRELMNAASNRAGELSTKYFTTEIDAIKASEQIDINAFGVRDKIQANAFTKKDALEFGQQQFEALIAFNKGDVLKAATDFQTTLGIGGTAYSQERGPLKDLEILLAPLLEGFITDFEQGSTADLAEMVTANALKDGRQLNVSQELLQSGIGRMDYTQRMQLETLADQDMSDPANRQKLIDFLDSTKIWMGELAFNTVEVQEDAATTMATATEAFKAAVDKLVEQLAQVGDTRTPRGRIGDSTMSNLGNTLNSHRAVNSGLAGKRSITSSYRNYALGSLKSDHVTGRALDIVGDNLVSYRDKMTSAGGLAEFHGKGDTRHLHVVPPQGGNPIGDSYTAVGVAGSQGSPSGIGNTTNNYSFNISGTNAEDIAQAVMRKIATTNKSNAERM